MRPSPDPLPGADPPRPGRYADARAAVAALAPREPVYCLYPHVLERIARRFLDGFPGRVLYAVKANPDPRVLDVLYRAGVRFFDTASVPEMELVRGRFADAGCYFMAPVRLRGAAREAYERHGVRRFVVDHEDELANVLGEIPARDVTVFARLATHAAASTFDLSTKFGASPAQTVALLRAVAAAGAQPALAFNVGSLVLDPAAYTDALSLCREVLGQARVEVRELDLGGGFPSAYPGLRAARLEEFFTRIEAARSALPLPPEALLLGEPGRAMVTEGLSVITQVLLRKEGRLYLNDGVYGSLREPVMSQGLVRFPTRTYRAGGEHRGEPRPFHLFGPTCDSLDALPEPFALPADIRAGDWIEFGMLGAYSLAMRCRFNGFYPETMVEIAGPAALPPGVA